MSLQKYAIIDTSITTGANVVNSIEYESQPTNPPPGLPETYIAVQSDTVSRYVEQTLETDQGKSSAGVQLALYFRQNAPMSAPGMKSSPICWAV